VADVSVIHPGAASDSAVASRTDGAAAAKREAEKLEHYRRHGDTIYKLVPFAVETLGRLGKPAMDMLRHLGGMAARHSDGAFTQADVVSGVQVQPQDRSGCSWLLRVGFWQVLHAGAVAAVRGAGLGGS
jgi:hypothetical protein